MNKITLLSIIALLFFASCVKEVEYNIPDVKFSLYVNLARPEFASLRVDGQAVVLNKNEYGNEAGYAGIIIIKSAFAPNGYYAFDRCCTHHPIEAHPGNTRSINPDGALGVCPFDSSTFVLINGSGVPLSGPAKLPLRPYKVSLSGSRLSIYN